MWSLWLLHLVPNRNPSPPNRVPPSLAKVTPMNRTSSSITTTTTSSCRRRRLDCASSDSEDDELLRTYAGHSVFAKTKPPTTLPCGGDDNNNRTKLPPQHVSPEGTQDDEQGLAESPASIVVELTQDEIEAKAQKLVQDIQYPAVERVDDFAALKWRRMTAKKGRTKLYYPCLVIPDDEARLIFDDDIPPSKTAIKYLGKFWKGATTMELVIRTTLFGLYAAKRSTMTEEEVSALNLLDQSDEEILSIFLNQEFPKQNDQQQAVRRRAEELVFQKTLDIVRRNQLAKEATKRQEEEELNQLVVAKPTTEGLVGHSKSANRRKQAESDDDDDLHEDGVSSTSVPFSPDSIKKRVLLRPGDVVEYYETNRVFGRADARRVSTIIGIDPRGNFPINLESGDPLQIDDRIRRIQKVFKGRLVDDTESTFRCVRNYGLRAAGTMKNVAAQRMVNKAKQLRTEYDATIEQHWTNQDEGCEGGDPKASAPVDLQPPANTHISTTSTSFADNWHKRLSHQIEVEEETMKKKRRYTPRITPSELQLVMKAWSLLENKIQENGTEFTDDHAIRILAQELSISEHRASAILQGDPKAWLSQRDKDEILEALGPWVEEGQSSL